MYNLTEYNGNCSKTSESLESITDDGGIVDFYNNVDSNSFDFR